MNAQGLIRKCKLYPFASIITLLTLILIVFTYIRSTGASSLEERYDRSMTEWNRIEANVFKNSVNLETHLETVQRISQDAQNRLVRPSELAKNYQYFFRLESATNVKILSLQQEPLPASANKKNDKSKEKEKPLFSRVPYRMGASGEFHELLSFLYALENGDHFYQLKEFSVQRASDAEGAAVTMTTQFDLLGAP